MLILWNLLKGGSTVLGAILLLSSQVVANEAIEVNPQDIQQHHPVDSLSASLDEDAMGQVTNVNQLRDISPTDWAYEALISLVERYGCIVGYPDQTFRGNISLSRYEFAAGLNACLNAIERLLQENATIAREDLDTLQRLSQEFESELNALGGRIDNLENRVAFLEDHQFSTTTKLTGESIVVFSGVWGQETASLNEPEGTSIDDGQITINYRNRLVLDTSFSGEDLLQIRFQTANFQFGRGGSNMTDFNFSADTNNDVTLNKLQYSFPVGEEFRLWFAANKITLDDISDPLAPYTASFTEGAVAFFPSLAPVYLINDFNGAGLGARYDFTENLNLGLLYSANTGFEPTPSNGLFNGSFTAGAQLTYQLDGNTGIALAYLRNYVPTGQLDDFPIFGFTGTANADNPFDGNATSSDNIALIGSWQISPGFNLSGWGMYTKARAEGGMRDEDEADIWNWKVSLAFPDLFVKGNLGAISVGNPPHASNLTNRNDVPTNIVETEDTPWLVETFYVFQLNENISITPAVWVAINPENDRSPLWVGALRTSFTF